MPAKFEIATPDSYFGEHSRGVDQSRRVLLPSEWRLKGSPVSFMILLWPMRGPDRLLVLPPKRWNLMLQNIGTASLTDESAAVVQRFISAHCRPRSLDPYGRLPLPDEASEAAGIVGEAVLVGLFDRFEIWSPERYASVKESAETQQVLSNMSTLRL
jgi:MraZ protein